MVEGGANCGSLRCYDLLDPSCQAFTLSKLDLVKHAFMGDVINFFFNVCVTQMPADHGCYNIYRVVG